MSCCSVNEPNNKEPTTAMPDSDTNAQKMMSGHATFLQNAKRFHAAIADSRRAQRGFEERRHCPPFRPGDWGSFPPTSRGESHADLSAMTARPPACYKQKCKNGIWRKRLFFHATHA
jgi:hypothetical protein